MNWKYPVALMALLSCAVGSQAQVSPAQAQELLKAKLAKTTVVQGADGWLFFTPELQYLTAGTFWGPQAAAVSKATNKADADPLPAILDFKAQLAKAGIDLLMVPVPAKAQIYPEMLDTRLKGAALDEVQKNFYSLLTKNGVKVLDLAPVFRSGKATTSAPLYCKQDTHWSSAACQLAARQIAQVVVKAPWFKAVPKRQYVQSSKEITITGDLWGMLNDKTVAKETLPVKIIQEKTAQGLAPVGSWRQSPVVLLGDSHNMVFSIGGDMLVSGAGLPDQLAGALGVPVDVVAVRGSGATPARVNLLRRGDKLAGKKLVIWCFTVREFTEGQGWKKIPIIK
ncbi:MAG: alginate O-acetyltransferase AlgX-related protein [Armatimonadota bacterium]